MKSSLAGEASVTKRSYALRREPHITTFHRLRLSLARSRTSPRNPWNPIRKARLPPRVSPPPSTKSRTPLTDSLPTRPSPKGRRAGTRQASSRAGLDRAAGTRCQRPGRCAGHDRLRVRLLSELTKLSEWVVTTNCMRSEASTSIDRPPRTRRRDEDPSSGSSTQTRGGGDGIEAT